MKRTTELADIKAPQSVIMETIRERLIERKFQIREFSRGEGKVVGSRSRMRQLIIGNIRSIHVDYKPIDEPGFYELTMTTSNFIIPALYTGLLGAFLPVFILDRSRFYYFIIIAITSLIGAGINVGLAIFLYYNFWNQILEDIEILSMEYEEINKKPEKNGMPSFKKPKRLRKGKKKTAPA